MRMSRLRTWVTFLLIVLAIDMAPMVWAPPEDETISITDTDDDGFMTEIGVIIDSSLVHVLDPGQDLISYLRFRGLDIEWWEPLENATLRLRTSDNKPFDDSSITIYGMLFDDLQSQTITPGFLSSVPMTSANVVYNTSNFDGQNWHEIDVTEIVQEIKSRYKWDSGDDLGFKILGAEGHDTRYFYDYRGNPSLSAQLVIHWNHEPTPPFVDATFVKEHGDNYTIWYYEIIEEIELVYHQSTNLMYHNSTTGVDGSVNWAGPGFQISEGGHMEKMAILDEWVLIIGDNGSTSIYYSDDEFSPGTIRSSEANHQFPILDSYAGNHGSIMLDQKDNQTFHVVWSTVTPWQTGTYNVVYSNFTILANGSLDWSPDYVNITNVGTEQFDPDIYCERDGTLHIAWYGKQGTTYDQIWYMRRYANGTWGPQVRVTEGDLYNNHRADVVANEDTGDALIVWSCMSPTDALRWDVVFPNNTNGPDRNLGTGEIRYGAMVNDRDSNVAHLVFQTFYSAMYFDVVYSYKSIDNSSSWSGQVYVSPHNEKHRYPSISVNEDNDTLAVIWSNEWNEKTAYSQWQIGATPPVEKVTINNVWFTHPNQPDNHERYIEWVYVIVDENGTNVANATTLGGAEDWIDFEDPDPQDPNPADEWPDEGPFTRFSTRMYIFIVGFFMVWGTVWFFAWKRPDGYYLLVGALFIIVGIGLIIHSVSI